MSASRARLIVTSWKTVRYELLNTPIREFGLRIRHSPVEPLIRQVNRELAAKGIRFRPAFYLTDSWGCPNEIPAVGIPFYLADRRLSRIEEEQTGEIEDSRQTLMYLRHEVGHTINYAFRLWERKDWIQYFGRFSKPYRDTFQPDPSSHQFVRHIPYGRMGRTYAQKHPDEDFAETFAVWLTPRSGWQRKYRFWPAIRKLRYVARLMLSIRGTAPLVPSTGPLLNPVEDMALLLADHYGQRIERYRAEAQGYVDDKLREAFPSTRAQDREAAADLIARHRDELCASIVRWSHLDRAEVDIILHKLADRATALHLDVHRAKSHARLMDLTSLATALAMDFAYTGRFAG